jgi:hypothetical protein
MLRDDETDTSGSNNGRKGTQPWLSFFLRAMQVQERRLAAKIDLERLVLAALSELSGRSWTSLVNAGG